MGVSYSGSRQGRDWSEYAEVAPPPRPQEVRTSLASRIQDSAAKRTKPSMTRDNGIATINNQNNPAGKAFNAELDICELDPLGRPGQTWSSRAMTLSRSSITFRSRRMCHAGRFLLIAIHLIDDKPIVLYGEVAHCQYENASQHIVTIELAALPETADIRAWIRKTT